MASLVDAVFREVLIDRFDDLELRDRNMLRFHYSHGLTIEQMAHVLCKRPIAVLRRLVRIRERLLRDTWRHLSNQLGVARRELEPLLELAHDRFDYVMGKFLRRAAA